MDLVRDGLDRRSGRRRNTGSISEEDRTGRRVVPGERRAERYFNGLLVPRLSDSWQISPALDARLCVTPPRNTSGIPRRRFLIRTPMARRYLPFTAEPGD